jgi:iron complex outermembrane recepter protein
MYHCKLRVCLVACVAIGSLVTATTAGAQEIAPAPLPSVYALAADEVPSTGSPSTAVGGDAQKKDSELDLLEKDIGELSKIQVKVPSMDTEVTTVSKQESTVGRSAAAVFVITNEMIHRSGATCVPDLLRMVPGVEVAQINSHTWAITIRGFNGRYSNKLLVLIDGRCVYTPLFSGTYWDVQDVLLEDIDRIEVIRGPGGTLWGANAVNGVINIITKKAQDTQGAYVNVGGGSHDRLLDSVRYGSSNGQGTSWRVYGKQFQRGPDFCAADSDDAWRIGRGGFRLDHELDRRDALTVEGDYYGGLEGDYVTQPVPYSPYGVSGTDTIHVAGANVLARWTHVTSDESDWSLQTYFDRTLRIDTMPDDSRLAGQQLNTLDVEFQHHFALGERHNVIWGVEYRLYRDYLPYTFASNFTPQQLTMDQTDLFVQDEITLVEDELFATGGCKFSSTFFTGFQYQPTVRLLWAPDHRHSVWGAVSRAVRTPCRFEEDGVTNGSPAFMPDPTFVRIQGSENTKAENMIAYELGYRAQTTDRFSWDVTLFYNVYEDLIGAQAGQKVQEGDYWVMPFTLVTGWRGQAYGVEWTGQYALTPRWRLSAFYAFMKMETDPMAGYTAAFYHQGQSPQNQARLQSSWDLGARWQFDLTLRYVDELVKLDVPSYIEMDARLGWRPNEHFEAALVGQNLLNNHHLEFVDRQDWGLTTEVPRAVGAQATWRY